VFALQLEDNLKFPDTERCLDEKMPSRDEWGPRALDTTRDCLAYVPRRTLIVGTLFKPAGSRKRFPSILKDIGIKREVNLRY